MLSPLVLGLGLLKFKLCKNKFMLPPLQDLAISSLPADFLRCHQKLIIYPIGSLLLYEADGRGVTQY